MRHRYAFGLAASLVACGGSHTSPQTPTEAASTVVPSPPPVAAPTPPASASPAVPAPSASAAPAALKTSDLPATISTAKAHSEGQHYVLDVKAPASVTVGGSGELEIVLLAKDGYHVNNEFPYKFKTASEPAQAVTFEKLELTRTQGTYTKTEARFKARFAGAKAGDAKVGGLFALSVCTAKECVVDKIQLEVPVTVR